MELARAYEAAPAILVLGCGSRVEPELAALCHEAGLRVDIATTRAGAFAAFADRGGHEALLCVGEIPRELAAVATCLREIDPDLPMLHVPTAADLTAAQLREIPIGHGSIDAPR